MNAHTDPLVPADEIELSFYRPNVGVVLFNREGRVWLGRRINAPGPHNWQFAQGGVDKGEDLYPAALRELQEETGVVSVAYLGRTEDWITYDFPRATRDRRSPAAGAARSRSGSPSGSPARTPR